MGNRFTFRYYADTFSVTMGTCLTVWAKLRAFVCAFNSHKPLERCNAEKGVKDWNRSNLEPRPGSREKNACKNSAYPYLEPRKVPLAEKA